MGIWLFLEISMTIPMTNISGTLQSKRMNYPKASNSLGTLLMIDENKSYSVCSWLIGWTVLYRLLCRRIISCWCFDSPSIEAHSVPLPYRSRDPNQVISPLPTQTAVHQHHQRPFLNRMTTSGHPFRHPRSAYHARVQTGRSHQLRRRRGYLRVEYLIQNTFS